MPPFCEHFLVPPTPITLLNKCLKSKKVSQPTHFFFNNLIEIYIVK